MENSEKRIEIKLPKDFWDEIDKETDRIGISFAPLAKMLLDRWLLERKGKCSCH